MEDFGESKRRLEALLDAALAWSPAQTLFQWRSSHRLLVLAYHSIRSPERFEQHLDHLAARMTPVSIEQVLGAVADGKKLPKNAVLVTFDDADRSHLDVAMPLMRSRGIPGIVFVVAGLLDTDHPFWFDEVHSLAMNGGKAVGLADPTPADLIRHLKRLPDEVRLRAVEELRSSASAPAPPSLQLRRNELRVLEGAGIAIGNHSLTHPCMTTCSDEKIESEVFLSHKILSEALGHAPFAFSYPNGDCDSRVRDSLSRAGYKMAFLFDHGLSDPKLSRPLEISRLRVNSDTSMDRFRTILSGLHPAMHSLRGRLLL